MEAFISENDKAGGLWGKWGPWSFRLDIGRVFPKVPSGAGSLPWESTLTVLSAWGRRLEHLLLGATGVWTMGQLDTPPVMSPTGEKKQDSSDQHKAPPGGPTTGDWKHSPLHPKTSHFIGNTIYLFSSICQKQLWIKTN